MKKKGWKGKGEHENMKNNGLTINIENEKQRKVDENDWKGKGENAWAKNKGWKRTGE